MRSLYDNSRQKPYATVNLRGGGSMSIRPSLIEEVTPKRGGYCLVKYGATLLEVKEDAAKLRKLADTARRMEAEARK